jgi:hypothetical protein
MLYLYHRADWARPVVQSELQRQRLLGYTSNRSLLAPLSPSATLPDHPIDTMNTFYPSQPIISPLLRTVPHHLYAQIRMIPIGDLVHFDGDLIWVRLDCLGEPHWRVTGLTRRVGRKPLTLTLARDHLVPQPPPNVHVELGLGPAASAAVPHLASHLVELLFQPVGSCVSWAVVQTNQVFCGIRPAPWQRQRGQEMVSAYLVPPPACSPLGNTP